jgi:YNFM family putative membrane transporter
MRPVSEAPHARIIAGTPAFRRINIAIFACGFSIFALLYSVQPILPLFTQEFGVSAAESSLALSLTAGAMALSMVFAGSASEVVGRKSMMLGALIASSLLTLALAFVYDWNHVLWLRALAGIALSGAPSVALAYLAEEMEPKAVAPAVGLYIGGSAFGGMSGRLVVAALADYGAEIGVGLSSWRLAMAGLAITGLVSALIFWRALPASRHFSARTPNFGKLVASLGVCARNPGIAVLLIAGFLMLGSFMTVYNYLGFRLQGEPFLLSQSAAGLVFLAYPMGSLASAVMGAQASRFGRGPVFTACVLVMIFGLALTIPDRLGFVIAGLLVMTFGFFGAHAIASSWAPAMVAQDKAQASSLYLLSYYVGGGVAGTAGGLFWDSYGWLGVSVFSGAMMLCILGVAIALTRMNRD